MSSRTICGRCGGQLHDDGRCECPPPSLEQRAIAAGLRWHWGGSYSSTALFLLDWWASSVGHVEGYIAKWYDGKEWHSEVCTSRRAAQQAVLAAWAAEQDKEKP